MECDKNKMISMLRRVGEQVRIKEVIFAELTPKFSGPRNVLPSPRISIPLSGKKWMAFANEGKIQQGPILPGQAVFCPPYCWSSIRGHLDYEMVGLVFLDDYLRVLYANQKNDAPRIGPDIFFHTSQPLNQAAWHLVHSLVEIAENKELRSAAVSIVQSVIELAIIDLQHSDNKPGISKATQTWRMLAGYIHENYRSNLTRTELADMFELHPAYVSRLFKQVSGKTLQDYIEELRMELAGKLLLDNSMSVNEIGENCGYANTSYFIRIFRKHFHKTPGEYKLDNFRYNG